MTKYQGILGACAVLASGSATRLLAQDTQRKFKIGACDWSLGRMQDVTALELAKTIGLDGVQVTFGAVGTKEIRPAQTGSSECLPRCMPETER